MNDLKNDHIINKAHSSEDISFEEQKALQKNKESIFFGLKSYFEKFIKLCSKGFKVGSQTHKNLEDGDFILEKSSKINVLLLSLKKGLKAVLQYMGIGIRYVRDISYPLFIRLKQSSWIKGKQRRGVLIGLLVGAVLLIIILFSVVHSPVKHQNNPSSIGNLLRINNIQGELTKIQNTLSSTTQISFNERQSFNNKLQEMDLKLGRMSQKVDTNQSAQINSLRATIQSNHVNLHQKIAALGSEIKAIKKKVFPAATLNAKVLPFLVKAIEPWNGEPFVQIQQRHNNTMNDYVGLYGIRGGWKVIDINIPEQTATFINENHQIVHVHVSFKSSMGN